MVQQQHSCETLMSTSSNHTKAFVQCCHCKHTVAISRTLLFYHEYAPPIYEACRESKDTSRVCR